MIADFHKYTYANALHNVKDIIIFTAIGGKLLFPSVAV